MTAGNAGSYTAASGAPDEDDAALIIRSFADPEQFAALFRRHAPVIQRYVTRRIGADAADDVVAETFLVAFRQRATYRTECPDALPWLYGIATHLVGRHRRTEVKQLRLLARTGVDPVAEPFTDRVDDRVSAASMSARLAAVLARLPAAQRDALLLVTWGGLSYDQVAIATGAPLGTVQARISRARRRLRQSLGDLDAAVSGEPRLSQSGPRRVQPANPHEGI
ncbi:MAG TPA: RNA polymerase sigma factor [Streptosporangiaceae bacterium]|jgi:RNA polymerase sigma-70 factor (ECF subfamily)